MLVTPWLSIGMDLPAYTLGCEVDSVATSSKGASLSVAARGVSSEFQCWGTGEAVQDCG